MPKFLFWMQFYSVKLNSLKKRKSCWQQNCHTCSVFSRKIYSCDFSVFETENLYFGKWNVSFWKMKCSVLESEMSRFVNWNIPFWKLKYPVLKTIMCCFENLNVPYSKLKCSVLETDVFCFLSSRFFPFCRLVSSVLCPVTFSLIQLSVQYFSHTEIVISQIQCYRWREWGGGDNDYIVIKIANW